MGKCAGGGKGRLRPSFFCCRKMGWTYKENLTVQVEIFPNAAICKNRVLKDTDLRYTTYERITWNLNKILRSIGQREC